MPIFHYKAKNKNAETIFGKIDALNKEDAIERINSFDLIPVELTSDDAKSSKDGQGMGTRFGRVRMRELYLFSRQFASLLKAGVSILRALDVLSGQMKNAYFHRIICQVRSDIQGGASFSDSIVNYPAVFPTIYVSMSRAGEEGGKLQDVIAKVADYLKDQLEIRAKIKTALLYPMLMLICGIGSVAFILTSVMPKITKIFVETDQVLPWPTVMVMNLSNFLIVYWAWVLLVIFVVIFMVKQWIKTKNGHIFLCGIALKVPILGGMWLKEDLARFSRTMALLIESGVSIVTAIKLSFPTVSNIFIREQLIKCQEELVAGRSFGEQIKRMSLIPNIMGDLIAVGEETGSLVPSLNDIAENYEQEIGDAVKVMTTLFEPIMIIVVGGLIGFVVIAMLLPIFQMDMFAR